jgi:hypothetical protein
VETGDKLFFVAEEIVPFVFDFSSTMCFFSGAESLVNFFIE